MASSATPAPSTRAWAPRSMFSDRPTGRELVTAFVLIRLSLLLLSGKASVTVECGGHDQDRAETRHRPGRRLDVVLAGRTAVDIGQDGVLVIGQDDDQAAFAEARQAMSGGSGHTPSTRTPYGPVREQQKCTPVHDVVKLRRTPGLQVSRADLAPDENCAVRDEIGSATRPVRREEGRLFRGRRSGSASTVQATSISVVLVCLIGVLGVAGSTAFLVDSITGRVRRAVRFPQAPAGDRLGRRLRLATRDGLPDTSRPVDAADVSDVLTATSGTPSPSAETSLASAGLVSTDADQITDVQAVAAGTGAIAPVAAEPRSVLPVIASVVRQAQLAYESALAQKAAKADQASIATNAQAAGPGGTTRYAAARGRANGPTTALWHAVQLDRPGGATSGACETTVCGTLVRLSREEWPVAARDVCPSCATLAH